MGLFTVLLLQTIGPPLVASFQAAVHPYTATCKQETCLARLHSLGQAIAMYAEDHNGRFPTLDYAVGNQKDQSSRVTWVTLLRQRTNEDDLICPLKGIAGGQRSLISSYGLNPVLAAAPSKDILAPASTLLLADRADEHDVSLLPPFASRPTKVPTKAGQQERPSANLDFRHSGQAAVLYADGHADSQSLSDWLTGTTAWGGSAVFRKATERISSQYPALKRVLDALDRGDKDSARRLLVADRKQVRAGTEQMIALWKQNAGSDRSSNVEKTSWRLADFWREQGDPGIEQSLDAEQSQRSQTELEQVNSGSWQAYESEWGLRYSIREPGQLLRRRMTATATLTFAPAHRTSVCSWRKVSASHRQQLQRLTGRAWKTRSASATSPTTRESR